MYIVIWKYKVKAEDREAFEGAYGRGGEWTHLFRKSPKFVGTKLYKGEGNIYLLIDAWDNRQSYLDFLTVFSDQYNSLCIKYKYLFEEEIQIGDFSEIQSELSS